MEIILFLILFVFILSYLVHAEWYFRRLKNRLPEVFAKIGSPSVIGKRQNPFPTIKFFASGEFRQIPDVVLINMGMRLVIHFFIVLIFFIGFFIFMSLTGEFS